MNNYQNIDDTDDDNKDDPFYIALHNAISDRFPTTGFVVSCFQNIDEINTKILCEGHMVIVRDRFVVKTPLQKGTYKVCISSENDDYFIIHSSNGKDVSYADVIDQLIKSGFNTRQNVSHKFLEDICQLNEPLMKKSIPCFGLGWGS